MISYPEFSILLMYLSFIADKHCDRITTDGKAIYFNPDWFQKLSPRATDFILCHELMHILLGHIDRSNLFKGDRYHLACDIIANSNLWHIGFYEERLPLIGTIYHETFFPRFDGADKTELTVFKAVPFDPSQLSPGKRRTYMIDSDVMWGATVPLSEDEVLILSCGDERLIEGSPEGHTLRWEKETNECEDKTKKYEPKLSKNEPRTADDDEKDSAFSEVPLQRALNNLQHLRQAGIAKGRNHKMMERLAKTGSRSRLDWRTLLNTFIQEEVFDYSFTPPDKRFQESGFFLPDYNDKTCIVKNILFMVDTSGSFTDEMLTLVYGEICGSIEQFDGAIQGQLGFFSIDVCPPIPFSSVQDVLSIRPHGGGGTSFSCIFKYIREKMETPPSSIVIFTDGFGDYPDESMCDSIPVLWVLTERTHIPPWGTCVTIRQE